MNIFIGFSRSFNVFSFLCFKCLICVVPATTVFSFRTIISFFRSVYEKFVVSSVPFVLRVSLRFLLFVRFTNTFVVFSSHTRVCVSHLCIIRRHSYFRCIYRFCSSACTHTLVLWCTNSFVFLRLRAPVSHSHCMCLFVWHSVFLIDLNR